MSFLRTNNEFESLEVSVESRNFYFVYKFKMILFPGGTEQKKTAESTSCANEMVVVVNTYINKISSDMVSLSAKIAHFLFTDYDWKKKNCG